MRKLFITMCEMETVPYLPMGMTTELFGAPLYEHAFRKIKDASNKIGLDVEFVRASSCDVPNTTDKINASFDDIVVFASPLAFLARGKDIEGALDYVIKNDVGYSTVGSLRSLYLAVGQGKMLDGCEISSPAHFLAKMNESGIMTFPAHFSDGEKSAPLTMLDYLKRVEEYRQEFLDYLVMSGVKIDCRDGIIIAPNTEIRVGASILPSTVIGPMTRIKENAIVGPNAQITDSEIGEGCVVNSSIVISSELEHDVKIAPFCTISGESRILSNVTVDSFTKLDSCMINPDVKISTGAHLSECNIGVGCIIGSGVVTVNFEGKKKNNIVKINDSAMIGNNATLVAPVIIGRGAFVGAGSTITDDVPQGALGIAREYQSNHDGWARRRRK